MTIRSTLLGIGALFWLAAIGCWLRARGQERLSREGALFFLLGVPFLVAGGFFSRSSYPLEPPLPPPPAPVAAVARSTPPASPPRPTPAPPLRRTYAEAVNAAQHAAVARYPELGQAGSVFNTRFVAAYRQRRFDDPGFFTDPEWPLHLADEIARKPTAPP